MMDPHEIANVLGMKGVELMVEEGRHLPLNVYATMPSCVPATADFETNGATLSPKDIEKGLSSSDAIIGLGEMMNYPGVLNGDEKVHDILKATLAEHKIITGHYPVCDESGIGINAYLASGARCCHETTRMEDALAKMRLGMHVQMREGSAWCDLKEVTKALTTQNIDSRFASLVSDDLHPNTLIHQGHMDYIIRRAIEEGIDPITAIQMATLNAAQCFMLDDEIGSVTPGKYADLVLLHDLQKIKVAYTIVNGKCIAKNGLLIEGLPKTIYPDFAKQTMQISKSFTAEDFKIKVPQNETSTSVKVHIIDIIEKLATTHHQIGELHAYNGELTSDLTQDFIKLVVIDRHSGKATMGKGFVRGFKLESGAVASTIAHDAHNLSVLGTNDEDMALLSLAVIPELRLTNKGLIDTQSFKPIDLFV